MTLEYAPLTAEKAASIQAFTARRGGLVPCDCTAGTLLTWCAPQGGLVRLSDDWFSAYWAKYGLLGFPLLASGAQPSPDAVHAEIEALRTAGRTVNVVIDAPAEWAKANSVALESWCSVEPSRIGPDYIYAASDLADLPGAKYSAKRNLVSQFVREHPGWRVEPLASDVLWDLPLRRFIDGWRETASDPSGSLGADLGALDTAFRHWDTGIFSGLALYADDAARGSGAILAFCVFSIPSRDMADIHFEKAAHDIKGASQLINRETARRLRDAGIKWINREQDMGVPGLRRAKMQYHPAQLPPTCSLKLL